MTDQKVHSETDVKQARKVPGMTVVLAASTVIAVIFLAAAFAWSWS